MTTTIKVSHEVRDRLKAQAAESNMTLGEHLRRLADLADRESRFEALSNAIRATPEKQLRSYRSETNDWQQLERA